MVRNIGTLVVVASRGGPVAHADLPTAWRS